MGGGAVQVYLVTELYCKSKCRGFLLQQGCTARVSPSVGPALSCTGGAGMTFVTSAVAFRASLKADEVLSENVIEFRYVHVLDVHVDTFDDESVTVNVTVNGLPKLLQSKFSISIVIIGLISHKSFDPLLISDANNVPLPNASKDKLKS